MSRPIHILIVEDSPADAAQEHDALTPVIIWTGSNNEDIAVECMKAGASNYVIKERLKRLGPALLHALQEKQVALERQRTETARREAEERYRALFVQTHDAVFLLDLQGRYLDMNPRAAQLLGYAPEELRQLSFREISAQVSQSEQILEQLLRGEHIPLYERIFRKKNGELVPVEINVELVRDANGQPRHIQSAARDISARKRADQALQASEEKYRKLFSEMFNGFALHEIVCDADGKPVDYITLEVNEAFERLLNAKRELVIGTRASALLPPEELQHWLAIFGPVALTAVSTHYEMYSPLNEKYFEGTAYCPEPGKFAVIFADITDRKRAEQALHASEQKFRSFVEQSADGIALLDEQGVIIEWNQAIAEMTGLTRAQMLGIALWDVLPQLLRPEARTPENFTLIRAAISDMLATGYSSLSTDAVEGEMLTPDGTRRTFQYTIFPIKTAKGYWVGALMRDVTAARRTQDQLQQLSRAVEQSSASIVITDTAGNIEYANPYFTKITGYTLDEARGKNPRILKSGHTTSEEYKQLWETILAGREWRGEFQNKKKNGELYWEAATISPIVDERGVITHFIAVKEDITERKQAEDIMRARINLVETAASKSVSDLLLATLDESEGLTDSVVGFFHMVEPDQNTLGQQLWSTRTLQNACTMPPQAFHEPIEDAGVWVECVRKKSPVIHNDFSALPHRKGLPEGHTELTRELVVPILRADKVVAVVEVGNKPEAYTEADVEIVTRLADLAWDIVERKQAEQALRESEVRYRTRTRELESLFALSTLLREAHTAQEMLTGILSSAFQIAQADGCAICLLGEDAEHCTVVAAEGSLAHEKGRVLRKTPDPGVQILQLHEPFVTADYAAEPMQLAEFRHAADIGPAALVPLQSEETILGALLLVRRRSAEVQPFAPETVRLLATMGEMGGNALRRARLYEAAQRRLHRAQALYDVQRAASGSFDLQIILDVALQSVMTQLNVDAAAVLLFNPYTFILEHAASRGFYGHTIKHTSLRLGSGYAGQVALERRTFFIKDLAQVQAPPEALPLISQEGFAAFCGVPLSAKGRLKGVLEVFQRSPLAPDDERLAFLESLAAQLAVAMDNLALFADLQTVNLQLAFAYDATIEGFSRALDLRDQEAENHSLHVTEMSLRLGQQLGLTDAELVHVRRGALLHDIGKIGIPDSILRSDKLSAQELEIMRQHPQYAYDILSPIEYLRPALEIPYCHHEHWDGTGYPRGLKGEQIPVAARLFAVADLWEVLTSERPYGRARTPTEAVAELRAQASKQFDPHVVEVFARLCEEDDPLFALAAYSQT
ncbi:MAG: PAS domain S-box protein [Chloroflexi bacterium]|nr:PAS domain S-box protein [Chloroflexota bacterium]